MLQVIFYPTCFYFISFNLTGVQAQNTLWPFDCNEYCFDKSSEQMDIDNFSENKQFENAKIIRGNNGTLSDADIEPFHSRTIGTFYGGWNELDGQGQGTDEYGFKTSYYGGSLGKDYLLGRYSLWGFTLNGARVELQPEISRYSAELNSMAGEAHIGLFGTLWYLDFSLGVGKNWNKSRLDEGSFVNEIRFQTTQWNTEVDFGLRIQKGFTKIDPFIGLHLTSLVEPGEAALLPGEVVQYKLNEGTYNSTRFLLGSRFHWEYSTPLAMVKPCIQIWWTHEFSDNTIFTTDEITDFPVAWRYADYSWERDRLALGTGLFLGLRDSMDLYCYYKTEMTKHYFGYILFLGFNKKF